MTHSLAEPALRRGKAQGCENSFHARHPFELHKAAPAALDSRTLMPRGHAFVADEFRP